MEMIESKFEGPTTGGLGDRTYDTGWRTTQEYK